MEKEFIRLENRGIVRFVPVSKIDKIKQIKKDFSDLEVAKNRDNTVKLYAAEEIVREKGIKVNAASYTEKMNEMFK